jgi:tetratricopeptide (TPR) repeat protein
MQVRVMAGVLALALATGGCAARQGVIADSATPAAKVGDSAPKTQEGDAAWAERGDLAKAKVALGLWEEAAKLDPTDAQLALKLAYGYYFVCNSHLYFDEESDDQQKAYFDKGVTHAERAIQLMAPDFAKQVRAGKKWEEAASSMTKESVPAFYWYATNLGKWATLDGITTLLGNKDRIFALMTQVKKLDETYFYGAPYRYFGVAHTKIPFPSGDLPASKKAFEKAIEIAPNYADSMVLFAEAYSIKASDKANYEKQVKAVLALPDDAIPDLIPETKAAKKKAERLLKDMDDAF